jgi:hypothetical protein
MFLSKKTATNLNKPKNQEANKGKRVLGGIYANIQVGVTKMKRNRNPPSAKRSRSIINPLSTFSKIKYFNLLLKSRR